MHIEKSLPGAGGFYILYTSGQPPCKRSLAGRSVIDYSGKGYTGNRKVSAEALF